MPKRKQKCIDCEKPIKSGNICLPCIEKRYPSKGNRGSEKDTCVDDKHRGTECKCCHAVAHCCSHHCCCFYRV